ncbi:MAG TPA: hypothetical protein VFH90_03875 [Candidatus Limnocylindria bacterium]|nr:hypothetical protein [Candidatus Limnocylindria bacterium]
MRKLLAVAVLIIGTTAVPALALGAEADSAGCWGSVTSQFAQSATGAMGDHSSSFEEPRSGIGNVAYANTGQHQPGVLGEFLGGLLGISC